MLDCTLEGKVKSIVQLAIIANTSGFLHQACFNPGTNRVGVGRTTHGATGALDLTMHVLVMHLLC